VFYLDLARAVALAFLGDPRSVAMMISALGAAYEVGGLYEDFTLFYGAALHEAARHADGDAFERLRRIVDDDGSSLPAGLAGHRALLDALAGDLEDATDESIEAAFTNALGHYATWGSSVHTARAEAAYGAWLTRRGRVADAQPHLEAARTAYADLGAVAWLEDLEQALAAHRVGS
jgi:hypothetical protein